MDLDVGKLEARHLDVLAEEENRKVQRALTTLYSRTETHPQPTFKLARATLETAELVFKVKESLRMWFRSISSQVLTSRADNPIFLQLHFIRNS